MATGRDLHIDVPLTTLVIKAFNTGLDQFIAQQVFPPPAAPVAKQSDKYYTIPKGAFLRIPNTKRAPKTLANRIEFDVSSDSYFADNYALAGEIALEDLSNADTALQLRQNTSKVVISGLLRDLEVRVANKVTSGTQLGSYVALSGGAKWNDFTNSSPISDVTTAHAFIAQRTGVIANTLIIDRDTLKIVRRHPELLDMYKYTSGGQINDQQLREVFEVERILVGRGIKENALEGGTSSMTNIWGNNAIVAYIDPNPGGLDTVTFGIAPRWQPEGFPMPFVMGRQRFEGPGTKHIEVIEGQYFQDEKVVAQELSYGILSTL